MGQLIRCAVYDLNLVLGYIRAAEERVEVPDTPGSVNTKSLRLRLFATRGVKCVCCGVEGKFFATEMHKGSKQEVYHFNLYAINQHGHEVLMTKDHIIPKSKGGQDLLSNLQTMCCKCNSRKGSKIVTITPVTHQENKHQSVEPDETFLPNT